MTTNGEKKRRRKLNKKRKRKGEAELFFHQKQPKKERCDEQLIE
jgi:hypothetical protein